MDILGYTDRLSVIPGQRLQVMVSCQADSYQVDLIRFDRAFTIPELERDTVVPSAIAGRRSGREQGIGIGSYVLVPSSETMRFERGLAIQAWICPTLVGGRGPQEIIARWDEAAGAGFALGIESDGRLRLQVGDGSGRRRVIRSDRPLDCWLWYAIGATYDAATGEARLVWRKLARSWLPEEGGEASESGEPLSLPNLDLPLLIGAGWLAPLGDGRHAPRSCFNGKIDRPRIWGRALRPDELLALFGGSDPLALPDALVAAWDFARDFSGTAIHDRSPNALSGTAVNQPTRGVTGANWDGTDVSFLTVPHMYGAIHFHEDDLEDAGWSPDFEIPVPEDLPSGVYAARLTTETSVEYVPFYVRRPIGAPTAPSLFLAPTNTYLAYGNERLHRRMETGADWIAKTTDQPIEITEREHFLDSRPDLGSSVYDEHPDGSGICYSSRLRPVITMRPQFLNWLTGKPRHFSGDLYLIEWLERSGFPYDVATDEDLHFDGADLLRPYRVVITGSHPEYWTGPMLDALEAYLSEGGRLMYLGGNGFYWVTAINNARPHLIEVRRGINGTRSWTSRPGESYLSLTGELGGLWRYRGRWPNALVGIGFTAEGWGGAAGYYRLPDSRDPRAAFVFEGIGDDEIIGDFGLILGGAAGDEIDRYDLDLNTPPEALRLATTEGRHTDYYQLVIEDSNDTLPGRGGTEEPRVRADMTLIQSPNGGAVFSVGSITWVASLPVNDFDNNVSRVTGNVLREFSKGPETSDG